MIKIVKPINVTREYYNTGSSTIEAAFEALAAIDGEVVKKTERLLYPVKKIIEGLDALSNLHSFIGGMYRIYHRPDLGSSFSIQWL